MDPKKELKRKYYNDNPDETEDLNKKSKSDSFKRSCENLSDSDDQDSPKKNKKHQSSSLASEFKQAFSNETLSQKLNNEIKSEPSSAPASGSNIASKLMVHSYTLLSSPKQRLNLRLIFNRKKWVTKTVRVLVSKAKVL